MKNVFIIICFCLIFSCNKNDDDDVIFNDLIELDINKFFLVDEKWFIDSIESDNEIDLNGDGNKTKDLLIQVPSCDLDSYYQFDKNQSGYVILVDGEDECLDNAERYGANVWSYLVDKEKSKIELVTLGDEILGGIKNADNFNQIGAIENVKFFVKSDSSFKLLKGEIQLIDNFGNINVVNYTLKANIENRP